MLPDVCYPRLASRPMEPDDLTGELVELTEIREYHPGSLLVSVDYLDLVDRYDEAKAWEILGKLKDLLA